MDIVHNSYKYAQLQVRIITSDLSHSENPRYICQKSLLPDTSDEKSSL